MTDRRYLFHDHHGGGWTLVSQNVPVNDSAQTLCNLGAVGTMNLDEHTVNNPAKLSDARINALWTSRREVMIKQDTDSSAATRAGWDAACIVDLQPSYTWNSAQVITSLAELQVASVRCVTGSWGNGSIVDIYDSTATWKCGFGFANHSQGSYYIYSAATSSTGGACGGANAGRVWSGPGNSGCNVGKVYIR